MKFAGITPAKLPPSILKHIYFAFVYPHLHYGIEISFI